MPLLNCSDSSKLALYFVLSLVTRAFQRLSGGKRDQASYKVRPGYNPEPASYSGLREDAHCLSSLPQSPAQKA